MFKKSGLVAVALAASIVSVSAAGFWWGLPILGNSGYCGSYNNGQCVSQIGPGEAALTGNELIPADTQLPNGIQPQTEYISVDSLTHAGEGAERNALRGGDFFTNLWQRGTSFSSITPSTATMTADGWAAYSSGNTTTITQDTTTADLSPSSGINAAMKIVRPTGTNTSAICVGQILPAKDSVRFIGKQAIFSFYAQSLSGYLAANKNIIATIAVYTATDSATPGTNTGTFMGGTITGYTVINPTSTTVTTAPNLPITTSWVRYSVNGTVPVTVSSNPVVGIGVTLCTPVYPASTGVAGDGFLIANMQLEAATPPALTTQTYEGFTYTTGTPGTTAPGGFARRSLASETAVEQSYSWIIKDGVATIRYGLGQATTTALATVYAQYPTPMRIVPVLTVGTTISFGVTVAAGTATTCGTSIAAVATSATTTGSALVCTTGGTALAAGNAVEWIGANTGGLLTFSAEP